MRETFPDFSRSSIKLIPKALHLKFGQITKNANHKGWRIVLERKTRLELATPTLARSCSTN